MREPDGYRLNLELLNLRFPESDMLTQRQVAEFTGLCVQTVRKRIRFNALTNKVSKADLARQICSR